jgi:hypothetical protein
MLTEPMARYAEVMWDIETTSNKERFRYMLIDAGYMLGDLEAEFGFRRLQTDAKAISEIYWEQAKAFAQTSHGDDAIEAMRDAIRYGMPDPERILREPELNALRDTPEFKKVVELCRVRSPSATASAIRGAVPRQPTYTKSEFQDMDGKQVDILPMIEDTTILFHWGTWSRPSREMIPVISSIKQQFESKGVQIYGIAYEPDTQSARERIASVLKPNESLFPVYLDHFNHGDDEAIHRELFPVTLVVNRKMQILAKLTGYQSEEVIAGVLNNLATASTESSSF